jgi:nucleotide-binding universal stress UspA family protein
MRRFVVAVDGSQGATTAVRAAIRLATPHRARVDALGVVPRIPEFARHPEAARALMERMREDVTAYVNSAQAAIAGAGLEADATILEGHPAEEICAYVGRATPDLTVLGSRGLGAQRIHLVGSVGYAAAHFAKSSVLIVRQDLPIRRILAAVDGSAPAARAAEWAAEVAKSHKSTVTLLYVIPQETEEVKFTVSRGVGEPFLGPIAKSLGDRGVAVERRVEYGRPAATIVHVAKEGYDLVVLGHQGRGALPAFALGGVTDKVLHYAPSSTLVVR